MTSINQMLPDAEKWTRKGNKFYDVRRDKEAVEHYNKAIEIDTNYMYTCYRKGATLYFMGEKTQAFELPFRIFGKDPKAVQIYKKSLGALQIFIKLVPCSPEYIDSLAHARDLVRDIKKYLAT